MANMAIHQEMQQQEFPGGREDGATAARVACACPGFRSDEAEEWVVDEERSCYNCRARRWTPASFVCLRGLLGPGGECGFPAWSPR